MKTLLDTILFDGYMVRDLLIVAGVAFVVFVLIRIIMGIFRKEESSRHFQSVDCLNCGWHGDVSRYAGRCAKCSQSLGEQKAQPRRPYGL